MADKSGDKTTKIKIIMAILWGVLLFSIYSVIQIQENIWRIKTKTPFLVAVLISIFMLLMIAYKRSRKAALPFTLIIFLFALLILGWKNNYQQPELANPSIVTLYNDNALEEESGLPVLSYLKDNYYQHKVIVTNDLKMLFEEAKVLTWGGASSVQYIEPLTLNASQKNRLQTLEFSDFGTYFGHHYRVSSALNGLSSESVCIFSYDETIYAITNFCNE